MSPELQQIIALLKSQLGYSEQVNGYTKFGHWYGRTVEFDADYSAQPWCDMFLSWAAHDLGYEKWFGQFAYTVDHAKWFIHHDAWGTTPEPGAVVFYDWSGSGAVDEIDHVGMVLSVDGDTIHTIEGNVDGEHVREKVRDQSAVVGYGYPDKIKEKMADVPLEAKGEPSVPNRGVEIGAAPAAPATDAPAISLTAAESPLPTTATMSVPAAGVTALGPQQPIAGAGTVAIPLLIAALVLIAYVKVLRTSIVLARVAARPGRQRPASRPSRPYRSAKPVSARTASRPRAQGRTIIRSTPSASHAPASSGDSSA